MPYKNDICLAIDHHGSQEFFAERTCLDAEAAACGEIVYEIVGRLTDITPEMALALYVAVSTDCGCFVYAAFVEPEIERFGHGAGGFLLHQVGKFGHDWGRLKENSAYCSVFASGWKMFRRPVYCF